MTTPSSTPAEALGDARARVEHDLGPARVLADACVEAAVAGRTWWLAQWPEGAEHVACLLAQDVQEAVHGALDPLWPLCPEHGDHPLHVEPDLGPDPFWVCHRSGLPVAAVGGL